MGMSNATESALRARTAAAWPNASRRTLGTLTSHGSDRLNTPFRRTLVYLLARTRGGRNRCRILKLLHETGPLNANQIASALHLHYTTVQHHLSKLLADDVVASNPRDDSYGALFFLTYQMERHAAFLDEVLFALEPPETAPSPVGVAPKSVGAVSQ
jgi:DNA-binding transcriptional ArsR family regulator